jgi:NDP-sugar pyrophosphorylase family protein
LVQSDAQGFLLEIEEKPKKSYFVSTGINVFKGDMIKKYLPEGYFDMPDFFNLLSASGESVYCLETNSVWLDLGRESDLVKANDMVKSYRE